MNGVQIRPMHPADRSAVVQILDGSDPWQRLNYTAADWDRIFCPLPQGKDSYVAELDAQIAAIAVVRRNFLAGDYLELLAVAPGIRRQGVGRRLLEYVEQTVFVRAKNLFACVSDFNEQARAFYRKLGYREVGLLVDFLIAGSSEVLIRKTVGPARGGR
ncbi:MAG: GNAT family N-acetyltransferase [Nitrospira sp.]|nr:GNAT family N-acetyltransferase [Nitrospira sp.]MCP9463998.1 GNAT family N-acetyltransferase [Nitrospira sp.]